MGKIEWRETMLKEKVNTEHNPNMNPNAGRKRQEKTKEEMIICNL